MLDEVREWSAWRNAGTVLRQAIGDFYARPCALEGPLYAVDRVEAMVELTARDVTFELVLGVERAELLQLATSMLGTSDEADALSLLFETANIAMGRFQASLIASGSFCSLGLPRLASARRVAPLTSSFHVSCRGAVIEVSLSCALKADANRPFTLA